MSESTKFTSNTIPSSFITLQTNKIDSNTESIFVLLEFPKLYTFTPPCIWI